MNSELISHLTGHPERMNSDSLYQLRTIVARYPYYQAARLLMLSNLYLLHDPDFSSELQRSVFYISDRRQLWQLVNGIDSLTQTASPTQAGATPQRPPLSPHSQETESPAEGVAASGTHTPQLQPGAAKTTMTLIDAYLETLPEQPDTLIPVTPVATDYLATLGWTVADDSHPVLTPNASPQAQAPKTPVEETPDTLLQPEFLTETLARIYIKQKKYDRALAIIRSLYLNFPEKSIYFADQIRFLEKLVRNNQLKKDK